MTEQPIGPSFVARIWLESSPRQQFTWRGQVRHVQSGRVTYFQGLDQMGVFLERIAQEARSSGLDRRRPGGPEQNDSEHPGHEA